MRNKILLLLLAGLCFIGHAQKNKRSKSSEDQEQSIGLSGLKFRELGPAITSGRIADFAVNPDNPKEYYVATAAGGVWKTTNAGTTYTPIFDNQGSYSIGCITMDPNNSNVIWVGTGEEKRIQ